MQYITRRPLGIMITLLMKRINNSKLMKILMVYITISKNSEVSEKT